MRGTEQPIFEKLTKWLRGIGSLIDGRIVISEKVLEFVNKDYAWHARIPPPEP